MPNGFRRDDSASAGTISFVIALSLFLGGVGYVLLSTQEAAEDDSASGAAADRAAAEGLADVLVSSPGIGWELGADSLVRLGLQAQNGSGLSADSLAAMRGGVFLTTVNGLLDYDEAAASLGVPAGDSFHIRIYPTNLKPLLEEADLSHLRVAYIGDWTSQPASTVPLGTQEQMVADTRTAVDAQMAALTTNERLSVAAMGAGFSDLVSLDYAGWSLKVDVPGPDVPLSTLVPNSMLVGDVYPDRKQYLNTMIPARLDQYDILIVGTGVDQSTLTSEATKDKIRTWTLAGGTLIVLGTDSQNFQWLQPLFSVGTQTVNGGAYAPDVNHPVLLQPYELSWSDYDHHGLAWDIKSQGSGAHYEDFSHVIVDASGDVLAISDEGAFGTGRIFLTTYRPAEIAPALGLDEAVGLLKNFVLFHDRSHLYLDYGPTVPSDMAVAQAQRLSHLWDVDIGQVPVRVEVLYWSNA